MSKKYDWGYDDTQNTGVWFTRNNERFVDTDYGRSFGYSLLYKELTTQADEIARLEAEIARLEAENAPLREFVQSIVLMNWDKLRLSNDIVASIADDLHKRACELHTDVKSLVPTTTEPTNSEDTDEKQVSEDTDEKQVSEDIRHYTHFTWYPYTFCLDDFKLTNIDATQTEIKSVLDKMVSSGELTIYNIGDSNFYRAVQPQDSD